VNYPFKFRERLWDVLKETLQSASLLHFQYKNIDTPLDGNKCDMFLGLEKENTRVSV